MFQLTSVDASGYAMLCSVWAVLDTSSLLLCPPISQVLQLLLSMSWRKILIWLWSWRKILLYYGKVCSYLATNLTPRWCLSLAESQCILCMLFDLIVFNEVGFRFPYVSWHFQCFQEKKMKNPLLIECFANGSFPKPIYTENRTGWLEAV